jgi:hypothetical protein
VSRYIFIQDLPDLAKTVSDIPKDFKPRSIGTSDEIVEKIRRVVPYADFSDVEWGVIEGPTYSIEVNIRKAESVQSLALHVRGDTAADAVITEILGALGLRALDMNSATGFFEPIYPPS